MFQTSPPPHENGQPELSSSRHLLLCTFDFDLPLTSFVRKPVTLYYTVVDKIVIRIVGLWFSVSHGHLKGEIHHALNLGRVFISVFKEGNLQYCSCTSRLDQAAVKVSSGNWMLRTLTKRI